MPVVPPRARDLRVSSLVREKYTPLLCGIAGVVPDLDIVFRMHRTVTHSIGAVMIVFLVTVALLGPRYMRLAAALAAAVASHAGLDLLGYDANEPYGVMFFWPFSAHYVLLPVPLFLSVSKQFWTAAFYTHNAIAVAREVLILGPVVGLISWVRSRRPAPSRRMSDTRLVEEP